MIKSNKVDPLCPKPRMYISFILFKLEFNQYEDARKGLIEKDLIAFNGTLFQVLDLPVRR